MINIDLQPLVKNDVSRYSLVVGVSKRAREISDKAKEDNEILVEKPVSLAINELIDGKFTISEPNYDEDNED